MLETVVVYSDSVSLYATRIVRALNVISELVEQEITYLNTTLLGLYCLSEYSFNVFEFDVVLVWS